MKSSVDIAVEAMRQSNPVPDPASLADVMMRPEVFLTTTKETTPAMSTTQQATHPPTGETPHRRRNLTALVAAFALVLVVGAIIALLAATQTQEPATPTDVTQAFIDARNAGDGESLSAMLSEGAFIYGSGADSSATLASQAEWFGAVGWEWTLVDCEEGPGSAETQVHCSYAHDNAWSRALGMEQINDGGAFTFVVADGTIKSFVHDWQQTTFSPAVWVVFVTWVRDNHIEQLPVILSDECCTAITTAEANAVWQELTAEFVAEVEANS
jgi:hypothetical protein